MDLDFQFANEPQRQFYYLTARNQLFAGGFNNGKSFIGCLKILSLLTTFHNSRAIIARNTFSDLKKTTMQTFFQLCPAELIASHNEQDGITILVNGSLIWWMHLDGVDENTLRGIEPNFILVDQAEETSEKVFDVLDARLGRWNGAIVPQAFLDAFPDWPRNKLTGRPICPSYHIMLCNPEDEFHYLFRKFHPDSPERDPDFAYVEGQWDRYLGSEESYDKAAQKDPEWVAKYMLGKWGISSAAIHKVRKDSYLEPTDVINIGNDRTQNIIEWLLENGSLYRSMDHGDSSPTCNLWIAAIAGVYIFYREYYVGNRTISYHRQAISDLSGKEKYSGSYADPQIFKKTAQKDGGFWSVADEYGSSDLDGPTLYWQKADNNEFATRNRINELLNGSIKYKHPVTGEANAPGIYFIRATSEYPYGCKECIKQLSAQRKILIGQIDGKSYYSDDRDESITDHAYDPIRYFVAMHGTQPFKAQKKIKRMSLEYYNLVLERRKLKENQYISAA